MYVIDAKKDALRALIIKNVSRVMTHTHLVENYVYLNALLDLSLLRILVHHVQINVTPVRVSMFVRYVHKVTPYKELPANLNVMMGIITILDLVVHVIHIV